jgi:Uncharacterized protein conserved in bacteria
MKNTIMKKKSFIVLVFLFLFLFAVIILSLYFISITELPSTIDAFTHNQNNDESTVDKSSDSSLSDSSDLILFSPSSKNVILKTKKEQFETPLDLPAISQFPELPTGCEVTAATMLLNYYGYDIDKEEFADRIPKAEITFDGTYSYSDSPNESFIGNPYSENSYGVFCPPVIKTMKEIINDFDVQHSVVDMSGSSPKEIYSLVDQGIPVMVWASINMLDVYGDGEWIINGTDETFIWPANEHALVLIDVDDNILTFNDPYHYTVQTYSKESFESAYYSLDQQAIIIKE